MIKVTVLGSAGSLPTKSEYPSCFAVKYGNTYLFDCCEGAQKQMQKHGVSFSNVDAVFLTHLHADHFLGLFGLMQTMGLHGRSKELLITGPVGTKKFLEAIFSTRELKPSFAVKVIEASRKKIVFENKLFTVTAFLVEHNTPALGYALKAVDYTRFYEKKAKAAGVKGEMFSKLLAEGSIAVDGRKVNAKDVTYTKTGKKIVFTGDTAYCASVVEEAKDADLLVHDSTFAEGEKQQAVDTKHSTSSDAGRAAKKAAVKQLLLTHFSARYEKDKSALLGEAKKVFANSLLAKEGLEIIV